MAGKKRKTIGMNIPTKGQLLYMIQKIDTAHPIRDRALIALEYLTGARVSEILDIKRMQIYKNTKVGIDFIEITNVKTLKRRKDKIRNILIPIEKEKDFLEIVMLHINKIRPDDKLFDITRQRAWQIIKENTGYFNHFFRHMRASHLTTDYGFTAQELKKFFDWASSTMADAYSHLNMEDIARKMSDQ